ncbi:hypothetical protein HPP92_015674 [Vanilla planifolia]|uniref:RRM domain-containing protein n=1 Tax=Vanilla planifolia TaxID=51239 RepID=A0A835URD3_VANPL|nr:hypothetical protein HPP92_027141 [Vanilla planifolia]KAG0471128.1 hypothetical protein HPP92_015674 [Vanilla planifolia]
MASTKKRKSELDSDNIPNAYNAGDVKQHYTVEYTRQLEDDSGDGAASGSDSDYVEEDDVRKLLEPLDSDQLISLLASAAARDGVTLAEIRALADVDPAHRKLFVHSLGWETTTDSLRAAFDRYGEIDDIRVVLDRLTGRSKGYGFILFRHRSSAQRALRHPHKLIDNRMTTCQLASVGPTQNPNSHTSSNHIPNSKPNPNPVDNLPRKIYVGNVHPDIDGRRLYAFFSQYGEIEEGPIGFDRQTGKPKGFALFVYRTIEGARKVLEEPNKNFEGHELICQRATDSSKGRASAIASNKVGGGSAVDPPNAVTNVGGFIASGYGGQVTPSDVGLAQRGQCSVQGFLDRECN